ncbi:uncharacterized protein BX663DRAFT_53496 [Cokeromyces recurvatus]|uniref:uncharacterized protein n=1 Tax=Cokeromyces recurvatus TaxID=90255 RepID=UPI00221F7133|nr:uncharacterized protein BX663DRAFT_53496 [Cokeromyces recurvatus]KAI7902860.1 hypothetical protein BX663DRAFT_53496 [Cokeromyces recurvatus]
MVKYRTGKQRGYGFNKTRIVREYNGNNSNYEHYNNSSYERYNNSNYEHYNNSNYGHYNNSHNNVQEGNTIEEEVFIVRNESNVNFIPPTPSFKQASSFSMTQLMNNNNNSIQDFNTRPSKDINEDEQAGFFFDLSAQQNTENNRGLGYNKTDKKQAAFLKHKKKIIQDENVYIDDDDENDDVLSISSSEDIEIIKGLSHWANKDILRDEANDNSESIDAINQDNQFEMGDLIQMLKTMLISDICDNEKPRVNTQNTFRSNRKSNPPPMSIKK